MRRRHLLGAMGAFAASGGLVSSSAFSKTEAQRGVNVDVVGDSDAYLEMHYEDKSVGGLPNYVIPYRGLWLGYKLPLVEFGNQFPADEIDFDVSASDDGVCVMTWSTPDVIQSAGDLRKVEVLVCRRLFRSIGDEVDVKFDVEAQAADGSTTVETTRSRTVTISLGSILDTLSFSGSDSGGLSVQFDSSVRELGLDNKTEDDQQLSSKLPDANADKVDIDGWVIRSGALRWQKAAVSADSLYHGLSPDQLDDNADADGIAALYIKPLDMTVHHPGLEQRTVEGDAGGFGIQTSTTEREEWTISGNGRADVRDGREPPG